MYLKNESMRTHGELDMSLTGDVNYLHILCTTQHLYSARLEKVPTVTEPLNYAMFG